jgi:phosphoribosylanthranilate isomerase
VSWNIQSSASSLSTKKRQAQENFWWLWERRELLSENQKALLWEVYQAKEWKMRAFTWLEEVRVHHDKDYARIKELEMEIAKRQSAIKAFEAKQAKQEHDKQEEALSVNRQLLDENYWLKTELSGLKQTIAWSQKAAQK